MSANAKEATGRSVPLEALARLVGGEVRGEARVAIRGVSGVREARAGEITFAANPKYLSELSGTRASAVILSSKSPGGLLDSLGKRGVSLLLADEPYFAFAQVVRFFHAQPLPVLGISPHACIGKEVVLGENVSVHPFVRIEDRVRIGDRVTLYPGTFVGEGSVIGDDCLVYPNVTIREGTLMGKRVILHSGVVVGSDGFGFATKGGKHHKIPQVGCVVIEDDVEIGANVTVDRAALGKTVVGRGTKIDNLVQVAHNVVIGEDCLIVAQAGISGSTRIGNDVILAGQVGVIGHLTIGDGVRVGAQSGVAQDIDAGRVMSGSPAIAHPKWLRVQAALPDLPEMRKRIRELEKKLESLERRLQQGEGKA